MRAEVTVCQGGGPWNRQVYVLVVIIPSLSVGVRGG